MRYAIVSDIHANLQAWKAVILDIRSLKADRIICLGDLVGYGPNPGEVLESVYASVHHFVLGNHDAALCGKLDENLFTESARKILAWSRTRVGSAASRFLRTLPLSLAAEGFRCTHGDFSEPGRFKYVIEAEDAVPSWQAVSEPLLFLGHSHRAAIFVIGRSGTPHRIAPQDFVLEEGKRFLVNVGSVGQPRDGDARASYCIFDTVERAVFWRRIPFDLDAYRAALDRAGVPASASYFLRHDPRAGLPPLREITSFSPPPTADQGVKNAVLVQSVKVLQGRVKRWRGTAIALLALLLVGVAGGGWAWWRYAHRALVLADPTASRVDARETGPGVNLLSAPPTPVRAGAAIAGWTVRLGNRYEQSVEWAAADAGESGFILRSGSSRDEMGIVSPAVGVDPRMGMSVSALFRKRPGFAGTVALVASVQREAGSGEAPLDQFVVKEPTVRRQNGWRQAVQTFDIPAGASSVRLEIRGRFTGAVEIKEIRLARKEPRPLAEAGGATVRAAD